MKTYASRFNWVLQLLLGLLVGSSFTVLMMLRMVLRHRSPPGTLLPWVVGAALVCGAFTSYLGNRFWYGRSMYDAEQPPFTVGCRVLSVLLGVMGLTFLAYAAVFTDPWSYHHPSWRSHPEPVLGLVPLGIAGSFVVMVTYALRNDSFLWGSRDVDKQKTPGLFWLAVGFMILGIAFQLAMAVRVFLGTSS